MTNTKPAASSRGSTALRIISFLGALACAAVVVLYPRAIAEDATGVPHGALVGMLFGMSILWVYGFGFTPQHRIFRYLLSPLLGWILLLGFGWIVFYRGKVINLPIEKTLYDSVGGDAGLDRLTAAFIRVLLADPQLEELRSIYAGRDLAHYEARLKEFLSGWLGGPPLYLERHGMPMLREGHRRLVITQNARYQWMSAMRSALAETVSDPEVRLRLEGAFAKMAESLVNTDR